MPTITPMTIAQSTGKIAGTIAAQSIIINRMIDWHEVQEIVIDGLKLMVTLTYLAGSCCRWLWDSLPGFSEAIGQRFASFLYGSDPWARLAHNGTVPYSFALALCAKHGLAEQFLVSYGEAADWRDDEYGNVGVDLGELNAWIWDTLDL